MTGLATRLVWVGLILTIGSGGLLGQSLPFRHYTPDSDIAPLPSAEVQKVFQDDQGFIWFAVYSSGLARFDGERLRIFTASDGLRDLNIWEVVQDASGRLWVGSDAGIAVSDRPLAEYPTGILASFNDSLGSTPLTGLSVRQNLLIADSAGVVWAAPMDHGILRYDVRDTTSVRVDTFRVEGPHLFQSLDIGNDGSLIVTGVDGSGGQVWRLEPDSTQLRSIFSFESYIPSATHIRPDGSMFLGTRDGRVLRTAATSGIEPLTEVALDLGGVVAGIIERSDDDLWVATEGAGLVRIVLGESGRELGHTSVRGVLSAYVHQIMLDREGNLWVAQSGGASKLPHNFDAYDSYSAEAEDSALESDLVTAVIPPEGEDCLWAGTIGGGITCIDALGAAFTLSEALPTNRVNAMALGEDGTIWLGTPDGIVALASAQTRLPAVLTGSSIDPGRPIRGLSRVMTFDGLAASVEAAGTVEVQRGPGSDARVGAVWFAASESVILHVNGSWVVLSSDNGLPSTIFRAVAVGPSNHMWIGTLDQGLYRSREAVSLAQLSPASGTRSVDVTFEQIWSETQGAPSNEIESILIHEGLVWVGTAGGLAALDASSGIMGAVIGTEEGLPAPNATSIDLSPVTETIWVGTNAGLAEVDPAERKVVRTITKADGLIDNEVCYYGSVRVGSDGSVYYGTCAGMAVYRPHLDKLNTVEPNPVITSSRYRESIWGSNELVVEFAGLSFGNERQVRYLTRLVGYDDDWSEPTSESRIRYTNLPAFLFAKEYEFQVRASNESGLWSAVPARISFAVQPPWWFSWWWVLIFHAIVGAAIFGYVRHKTKQNEAKLAREREINEQLRRVDRLKDEFLANTSHELRTPLNGIIGIVESLLDGAAGGLTDVMSHNLHTVVTAGKRLASLVDDILDFSKLKEKGLELNVRPVSLSVVADVALMITEPLLAGKDIMLSNDIDPDFPPAMADEDRLQQILLNVIGNAVKFTHDGEVRLFAEVRDGMAAVSVADTGIGIPADRAEAVFASFEQVDASTSREYGGTGLGLSVTKQLVELHGGRIWFESEVGAGTTFTFTLPLADETAEVAPPADSSESRERLSKLRDERKAERPSGDGVPASEREAEAVAEAASGSASGRNRDAAITVLVVDDEPVNQQVLANHLSNQNFKVVQAMNGMQAIEALDTDTHFDVVLLDVMMPRMSGYEVCAEIRKKYLASELPVIMVTAKNQVSDLVHGLSIGANDYLAKPFSKDELIARLRTHLNLLHINTSYGRFVPREFLRYLDKESFLDVIVGDSVEKYMTIFSSDIRSFTTISEGMTPEENFRFINEYMAVAGPVIRYHNGFIDSYIGDAIMALFAEKADDALDAAIDTFRGLRVLNEERATQGKIPVRIGVGIHHGKLQLGIVGEEERAQPDIISDAVNLTARIEGLTKHYGASVIVSQDTVDALHNAELYRMRFLGDVMVKGKNEPVRLIEMFDGESEEVIQLRLDTMDDYLEGHELFAQQSFEKAVKAFERVLAANADDKAAAMYADRSRQLLADGVPDDWTPVDRLDFK